MFSCALFLLVLGEAALADTAPTSPAPEAPFFGEFPEVITATRLVQRPQDAPAATFVIDREMIEASGAREIADLLRLAPGFLVASDGTYLRSVGYHGFIDEFGRRLQVLVDGRTVYTPLYGGLSWSDLPLAIDDIDRIEVIRGPNGATHGANAFSGVVNILTRHPEASQGLYMRAAGGDPDYFQGVFRHGFTQGPVAVRYTLGHEQDAGFTDQLTPGVRDAKRLNLLTVDASYEHSTDDRFRMQAGVKAGDVNLGYIEFLATPPRTTDTQHAFAQFDWEHEISSDQQLKLLVYAEQSDYDDDYPTTVDASDPENPFGTQALVGFSDSFNERRLALELQHLSVLGDAARFVWGFELRADEIDAPGWIGLNSPVDDRMSRVFANFEWKAAPRWTVNAGLMYETHEIADSDFSPRVSLNYSATDVHTFRMAASRSVRSPSVYEARWDQIYPIDLDLSPIGGPPIDGNTDFIFQNGLGLDTPENETLEALELGWMFQNPGRWPIRGDIKAFYEKYEGLIQRVTYELLSRNDLDVCNPSVNPVPPALGINCNINPGDPDYIEPGIAVTEAFMNQVDVDLYGLEASLEWRPTKQARLIGAYSFTEMRNISFQQPGLLNNPRSDGSGRTRLQDLEDAISRAVPTHIGSLLAIVNLDDGITLSGTLYHVSEMRFRENSDDLDGYTRLDLKVAKRFRVDEAWNLELYGVVQNLGDEVPDFNNRNMFDTRAFLGIKLYR